MTPSKYQEPRCKAHRREAPRAFAFGGMPPVEFQAGLGDRDSMAFAGAACCVLSPRGARFVFKEPMKG
jgi:hypothetical protein